ncbi:MAG: hypothetical protein IK149_01080 [Oscillospiraceae bacterium]|nr:hypothetical protein [Oscillospiraceae bacterium]
MALDQAYFDSISIDIVKKKYYNANKVEAVLEDIRRQALLMNRENELLARQLYALHGQKDEISDTLMSAKAIAQQIIADAQGQAEKILTEARRLSRDMSAQTERECREARQEAEALRQELPQRLDELERQLRVRLLSLTDEVCGELRSFSVDPEEEAPADPSEDAETPEPEDELPEAADEEAPADLGIKLDAIAREIAEIEGAE